MDARDIVENLEQRFDRARHDAPAAFDWVLDEFVRFAEVPVTYEGGHVRGMDTVVFSATVYDEDLAAFLRQQGQTCEAGTTILSLSRDLNVEDADGTFQEHVGVAVSIELDPAAGAPFAGIGPIVAPSGRYAEDETYDEFTENGDGVTIARTLSSFPAAVRRALPADPGDCVVSVEGNAAGEYDEE